MMKMATPDTEEFWQDLLAFIEEGQVLPVIGQELLTIEQNGVTVTLCQLVAERLLAKYGFSAVVCEPGAWPGDEPPEAGQAKLRRYHELNDAVVALAAGRRVQDLYRPVNDILREVLSGIQTPLRALEQLAAIKTFDLFATTTSDDLLANALDRTRFHGLPQADQIVHAPGLPSNRVRDLPEVRSSGYAAVFYLFGKSSAAPLFAIHEEDVLEYIHNLQSPQGCFPERMLSELRTRSLLLIGCNFADWLSRFFIRLSNSSRLSSADRIKKEFLIDQQALADTGFTMFLERFSQNTRVYPGGAHAFVGELYERWSRAHPKPAPAAPAESTTAPAPADSAAAPPGAGTMFVSYSSTDVGAAKRFFAGLQEIGGDVAWFDKAALQPGDDWKRQILGAIERCRIFLPLISKSTEERTDGFFRREWDEAAERSRSIEGRKFLFPVVIDPEYAGNMASYQLVPERFHKFQYNHAPLGEMGEVLRNELIAELRLLRRVR